MYWQFVIPVIVALISGAISFSVGQRIERSRELGRNLEDLEKLIWTFSQQSAEYWTISADDSKSGALEIAMKHLSTRIGNVISRLNTQHRGFEFNNFDQLISLRQAALGSPFEEITRQQNVQRGDDVRKEADRLVSDLYSARRGWIKF